VLGETAQHKLNVTALWRTRANFDFSMDLHVVSGVTWFEKSFDLTQTAGVLFTPYSIPAYTLLNGRVGYRWVKDKLETGVAFYNLLGDNHREHPFGNEIGRRVLFTASGSF
jgi:outer membrane receptor protein involved in Fe transport